MPKKRNRLANSKILVTCSAFSLRIIICKMISSAWAVPRRSEGTAPCKAEIAGPNQLSATKYLSKSCHDKRVIQITLVSGNWDKIDKTMATANTFEKKKDRTGWIRDLAVPEFRLKKQVCFTASRHFCGTKFATVLSTKKDHAHLKARSVCQGKIPWLTWHAEGIPSRWNSVEIQGLAQQFFTKLTQWFYGFCVACLGNEILV